MLTGHPAAAADYYRRAVELAPDDAQLRTRLVVALLAAKRNDAAAKIVADLKTAKPGEADYLRGIVYRENGDLKKALASFAAAAPYYQADATFWQERGKTYEAAGNYGDAVRALGKAIALAPTDAGALTARGVVYLRLGDRPAAARDFHAALALQPGAAQAHYNLACIYALDKQPDVAFHHLERALSLNPARYVDLARRDADLASCRESAAFERLLRKYEK